jgi:hypothetical protein
MRRLISWLMVAAIGFALMAFSYFNYQYQAGPNPWKDTFMYIGKSDPNSEAEGIKYFKRPIRLLPISHRAQKFTSLVRGFGPHVEKSYRAQFEEKVILYPDMAADFTDQMLQWGRLPNPDTNEVVAGFYAGNKDKIAIDGRMFKVVGQLKKEVRLFVNSYLICGGTAAGELFNHKDEAVQNAYIIQLPGGQLADSQVHEQLKKVFPKSQFVAYAPLIQAEQVPFYLYILGMTLLFSGGSVVLFKVYCFLSERLDNKWLRPPLDEIRRFRRLFLGLHLVYFGAVILFMLLVHTLPELQVCLLGVIKAEVSGGSGPLGVAGKAYMSKSIPTAMVITFLINFLLGSLAYITIPSIIIPGIGILAVVFRASMWGLLLAPNFDVLAGTMLPHSPTILFEGEGYILAAFFTLLIPIYLFRKAEGQGLLRRYGKALLMNVRGNLLVAIVLAIAAIYEAIELILIAMKD